MSKSLLLPVYEEDILGGFYSLGEHEFAVRPARGDILQTVVDEQGANFEVLRIEHRTTAMLGIPLERRLLTAIVVVIRIKPTPE